MDVNLFKQKDLASQALMPLRGSAEGLESTALAADQAPGKLWAPW